MNRKTLAAAFPHTVPVLMGYLSIGVARNYPELQNYTLKTLPMSFVKTILSLVSRQGPYTKINICSAPLWHVRALQKN